VSLLARTAILVVVALSACTSTSSPTPSATPRASPGASPGPTVPPAGAEIDHATGAGDVIFRFEEGGGLVPIGFFPTEAPIFTLFGDGRAVLKDVSAPFPPQQDGIIREQPFLTVMLSEAEVQSFLQFAVADGALGVARAHYDGPGADLPTAIFTLNAAGQSRRVSVMALGMEREPGPDSLVLEALARLGGRIRGFAAEVDDEIAWTPDRWRGVLAPDAIERPRDWPWPNIAPADFLQHLEPGAPQFPVRTMTPGEVDALGFDAISGGFSGLDLAGPDGRTYTFALRPLLPDEAY
jgi:hypothetical protein